MKRPRNINTVTNSLKYPLEIIISKGYNLKLKHTNVILP